MHYQINTIIRNHIYAEETDRVHKAFCQQEIAKGFMQFDSCPQTVRNGIS